MDNSSKNQNTSQTDNSGTTGEIFSQEKSAYGEATNTPLEEAAGYSAASPAETYPSPEENTGGEFNPPPPYVTDNRRKFIIIFFVIIFILLLLFGVSSFIKLRGQTKSPQGSEKIILTYWGLWEEEEIMRPLIDAYQKQKPDVEIKYSRQDPKQYRERLQATIDRGEGPDIYRFHNTWTPMMLKYLAPVPDAIFAKTDFEKLFYPVVVKDLKVADMFYGIPLSIDGLLLFYNEDILKGANVSVPKTWVDVQDTVPKLTVKEKEKIVTSAIALGTAENTEHFSDILGLMMLQNGSQLYKSLFSCNDTSSVSCSVEALNFYRKFAEEPNNSWDDTLENSILAFAGGKVAMIIAPSWQAHVIQKINPDLKFKTAMVPQLPCDREPCPSVNWASYWVEGVSSKAKNLNAAFEFLKFLVSSDSLQKLYSEEVKYRPLFGEAYSRTDLADKLKDHLFLAPLIESAPTMQSFYLASRTNDGETGLNSSLITYLNAAVNSLGKGVSSENALKTADNGFREVMTRFGLSAPQ